VIISRLLPVKVWTILESNTVGLNNRSFRHLSDLKFLVEGLY